MKVSTSRVERALGALMVLVAIVYLVQFVPRGWMPHDEGMLGQSADRVLHGGMPHVDYEEAYTGALSWLYAGVFRAKGVDLLNVRWVLFIAASWATWLEYVILRRYVRPAGAGLAAWVAVTWSFPNYFAGLPSWWLLICALACVLSLIRYVETGRWRHVAAAGLAAGLAMAIKQTGVYLLVALMLSLLYGDGRSRPMSPLERLARWGAAVAAIGFAAVILAPRMFRAEGLYLFFPALVSALVVALPRVRDLHPPPSTQHPAPGVGVLVSIAAVAAAAPLACLVIPYAVKPRLWDFVYGAFVLPRKRLAFASMAMPDAVLILSGVPLLRLVFSMRPSAFSSRSPMGSTSLGVMWAAAILVPILALWNAVSYQIIWQSSRAIAVLLPLGICWRLASGRVPRPEDRPVLFAVAATLAWTSLNQFPFAAPIYFCYVAPLAVIGVVAAKGAGWRVPGGACGAECGVPGAVRDAGPGAGYGMPAAPLLAWAVALLLFAVLIANRGYIENLGLFHAPRQFDTALNLPRAHLMLGVGDVDVYRSLVSSIEQRLRGGQLIAGPDCPEVYFLAGLTNPAGTLFDFFSETADRQDRDDITAWSKGAVIVLNHGPQFSPAPSGRVSEKLRREFPNGEEIGRFEIRWR